MPSIYIIFFQIYYLTYTAFTGVCRFALETPKA